MLTAALVGALAGCLTAAPASPGPRADGPSDASEEPPLVVPNDAPAAPSSDGDTPRVHVQLAGVCAGPVRVAWSAAVGPAAPGAPLPAADARTAAAGDTLALTLPPAGAPGLLRYGCDPDGDGTVAPSDARSVQLGIATSLHAPFVLPLGPAEPDAVVDRLGARWRPTPVDSRPGAPPERPPGGLRPAR